MKRQCWVAWWAVYIHSALLQSWEQMWRLRRWTDGPTRAPMSHRSLPTCSSKIKMCTPGQTLAMKNTTKINIYIAWNENHTIHNFITICSTYSTKDYLVVLGWRWWKEAEVKECSVDFIATPINWKVSSGLLLESWLPVHESAVSCWSYLSAVVSSWWRWQDRCSSTTLHVQENKCRHVRFKQLALTTSPASSAFHSHVFTQVLLHSCLANTKCVNKKHLSNQRTHLLLHIQLPGLQSATWWDCEAEVHMHALFSCNVHNMIKRSLE